MTAPPDSVVDAVLARVDAGPARLAGGRLLCIDGPAGAGKTTLAEAVLEARAGAVVHLDDLLDGWDAPLTGLVTRLVTDVLTPLAAGRAASYRRYDWVAGAFAERVPVPPVDLLVVEGVGAGSTAVADHAAAVVWVEAPHDLRRQRGIARDGDAFAPHWDGWARREAEHFAQERTRERSDLVVSTDGS